MNIIEFDNQKFYKTKYEGYYVSKEGNIISIKVKGGNGKIDYNNPRYHCVKVDKDGYYEMTIPVAKLASGLDFWEGLNYIYIIEVIYLS